ncbi:Ig-like domain-containing protein [Nocardioides sp.]|uniref:L,D-transpeptidase n=1 Tax=Nocardioides sp. TaxID=35761 RepID=UPI00261CEF6A|nr:Ig-like domain-containing protein [Nocardioides sp.]
MFVSRSRRLVALVAVAALASAGLAACSPDTPGSSPGASDGSSPGGGDGVAQAGSGSGSEGATEIVKPVLSSNVSRGESGVPVSTLVSVAVEDGSLSSVKVTSSAGQVAGSMSSDGISWTAEERLEPATTYTVAAVAQGAQEGSQARRKTTFTTQDLSLSEQTYASIAPLQGETVGVGMPVIVTFDIPVRNKAEFEKHMTVSSAPQQTGAWHWLSDTEAHWRPKTYWKAGTEVAVDVDVNGVDAGNGIYGQMDRDIDFKIGDANIYKVNAKTHQMKVLSNGKVLRTIPITTGKAGFTTRSGTKVIIEKFESKRMNSETVGITGSEAYDIDDVQYAMRLTYSGEFIHAAPWSVGSQGNANVSHGCTGMSTEQARWLYGISKRGDVVEYTGTDRPMTFTNGYGDWNQSFTQFAKGSAL